MIADFLRFFTHPWHWIEKLSDRDATWRTETGYPIMGANLWHYWQSPDTIIGVRFGASTLYGLIDVDLGSAYHPANNPAGLSRIRAALEKIGIYRSLLVQSSESGGLHLYFAFVHPVPSIELAHALQFALLSSDLHIAAGTIEIFPNAKRYRVDAPSDFAAHRLPLQQGSLLLDDDCNPYSDSIAVFLALLSETAKQNDLVELESSFATSKQYRFLQKFGFNGEPKGERGKRWKAECERVIASGWTAHGQTNQILGVIAQYGRVFQGLSDQALEQFVLQTAIDCPGYSQWCRHQHEIAQRCRDWAHSAQKAYTPYVGDRRGNAWKERLQRKLNPHNLTQSATALERIKNAIAQLGDRIFGSIREKAFVLSQLAQCSIQTLYRHPDLWRGCNSQNEPLESDSATDQKVLENDAESLEPLQAGLLHPNLHYEGVGTSIEPETSDPDLNYAPESDFSLTTDTPSPPSSDRKRQKPRCEPLSGDIDVGIWGFT